MKRIKERENSSKMLDRIMILFFVCGNVTTSSILIFYGLWFLSSALPLINIYVCTKFNFNPFCTFQDMAQTVIYYEKMVIGR